MNRLQILGGALLILTASPLPRAEAQVPIFDLPTMPPPDAPVQIGSLVVAPVVQLANGGYDSNANSKDPDQGPRSDYTAILSPAAVAWLTSPHIHLTARGQADYYFFKEQTNLRALDTDASTRVDIPLNRLSPYFFGELISTQFQQNLEILDAIARRRTDGFTGGTDVRVTDRLTLGAFARRTSLRYDPNSLYQATDLAKTLNHVSTAEGAEAKYAITPFTSVGMEVEQERSRFDSATDRDAKEVLITPEVWFSPLALVSGHAALGFRRRSFLSGGEPDFNGTAARADLTYTLLGRTRFTAIVKRDLDYTYIDTLRDFIILQVDLFVTSRLGDFWDVGFGVGRDGATYLPSPTPIPPSTGGPPLPPPQPQPSEQFWSYTADIGYRTGRARIGLHGEYRDRTTDYAIPLRTYERYRIGTTVTYPF